MYVFKARYVLKHSLNEVFNLMNTFSELCQTAAIHKIKQKNPLKGWGEIKWSRAYAIR